MARDAVFGLASLAGLAVAVLAMFLFGWLADEMLEGETLALDLRVRAATHAIATPGLTHALRIVSLVGGPSVLAVLGAVLAAVFVWHRWWRGAIVLLVAMVGAGLLDTALKLAFRRTRPTPYFGYPLPDSYSFPSGHALFAFCFFTAGAALLAPRLQHPALRWLVMVVALVLVLAIGFSRIYLGVHYPSDVLAGYAVGLLWSSVLIAGDRIAHARARRRGGA
ncbi:MAG TPA: phosphatase PAP2 family protein [Gemmatimonadales bacterium]|nr:phosphatase PAP2 family protein [Gemmatimonadales bacterium]